MPSRVFRSTALAALPVAIVVGLLTGCTSGTPTASGSPAPTGSATSTAEPSATPTPTPTAAAGTPITIGCDQLLTPDDVYAFNPNVGTAPDFSPTAGTPVAAAAADNGLACGWLNQTSGEVIEMAVAQPAPEQLTTLKQSAAASMTAVPTYGTPPAVDGFFTQSGGTGTVEVFTDTYWLTARSTAFFEPGDAGQLVEAALSHLP